MRDSSNHEDVDEHPKFSDHGCHDLCTSSFNHIVHSLTVNMSRPLVPNDIPINEVKTPQAVEALHPELMVMLGPCCPEVGFTYGQEIVETLKASHHSQLCFEYQPNT